MTPKKVYVLVTIDTECDKGNPGWLLQRPMSFKNIPLQKELLMPIFKKHGIVPTFLLSPEVLSDEASVNELKSLEDAELGTHLHEEFIGPNANFEAQQTKNIQAGMSEALEREKLENLTSLFIEKMGYAPKSFRSGRFGRSENTSAILADLGYLTVSDVVPYTYKDFGFHAFDYYGAPIEPYWETFENNKILQVPLTKINPDYHKVPFFLRKNIGKPGNFKRRIAKKMGLKLTTEWLRPYRESGEKMINIAEYVINNHFEKEPFVLLNIMFHSNEILVNGSPYCKSEEDVNQYLSSLEKLFNHLNKNHQLCSTGLGDVYGIYGQD